MTAITAISTSPTAEAEPGWVSKTVGWMGDHKVEILLYSSIAATIVSCVVPAFLGIACVATILTWTVTGSLLAVTFYVYCQDQKKQSEADLQELERDAAAFHHQPPPPKLEALFEDTPLPRPTPSPVIIHDSAADQIAQLAKEKHDQEILSQQKAKQAREEKVASLIDALDRAAVSLSTLPSAEQPSPLDSSSKKIVPLNEPTPADAPVSNRVLQVFCTVLPTLILICAMPYPYLFYTALVGATVIICSSAIRSAKSAN